MDAAARSHRNSVCASAPPPRESSWEGEVKSDRLLFARLIVPLEERMMRTIWRIVRHPEAAEDTLQEVMAILWSKLHRIVRHPNPQALVLKICHNAAYDTLRKHMRNREKTGLTATAEAKSLAGADETGEPRGRHMEDEVLQAIGGLPRKQALALLMRVVQDQPYDEIAMMLGCSPVTARIHVSKGRANLCRRLAHLLPGPAKEKES